MIDGVVIFLGGLLGSAHCVGMCGGFALALGTRPGLAANLGRQTAYSLGRIFTYASLGAMAGFTGRRLMAEGGALLNVQAALALTAGVLLVLQGLSAAGLLPAARARTGGACLGPGLFAGLLGATRLRSVFLGGVVNGLLPCGLVYAYLALAASSADMATAALVMALFGLGTLPVMVLVGCGGSLLGTACRHQLLRVAAWCVILTGLLSIYRGVALIREPPGSACPFCLSLSNVKAHPLQGVGFVGANTGLKVAS